MLVQFPLFLFPHLISKSCIHLDRNMLLMRKLVFFIRIRLGSSLLFPLGNKKIVGCHWVYIVKYLPDGFVERHKAWLIAKGYI